MQLNILCFLFASYLPDSKVKKPETQKNQWAPKTPPKHLFFQERGSQQDRKFLDSNHSSPAKHHKKNCGPTSTHINKAKWET